ncbi:MAG TPA: DUF1772 domain-containing protein [Terriglobales bacterium]|nr:DUF1772 domain-containing protein [Terriglobales bacterium]
MFAAIIDFANVLLGALVVGAMFGVWLIFNPSGLNASNYVALQQRGIRTLHPAMPALGVATILVTITAASLGRGDRTRLWLLIGTAGCFVAAGLITKFLNQPINVIVTTWSSDSPPANWTALRDAWWRWHLIRMIAGLGGLSLLIAATLQRGGMR